MQTCIVQIKNGALTLSGLLVRAMDKNDISRWSGVLRKRIDGTDWPVACFRFTLLVVASMHLSSFFFLRCQESSTRLCTNKVRDL